MVLGVKGPSKPSSLQDFEGAKVVFGDILDDAGKQVEAEIHEAGAEATYVNLGVTREDDGSRP